MVCCVDSSMLLFENCRELSFQTKSANSCSANYAKQYKYYHWLLVIQSFQITFEDISCWSKHALYVKIAEIWIFRHSLLIVTFLGMFCKFVFCKLQIKRCPSNITWNYLTEVLDQNSHLTFMAPIDIILQKGHSYQKYHLTKMAPNINDISHKTSKSSVSHKTNLKIPF